MSIFDVYNRLRSEIRSRVSLYLQRRYSSSTSSTVRSRSNVIDASRRVYDRVTQGYCIGSQPDVHSPPPVDTQKLTPFHRYVTAPVSQRLDQTTGYLQERFINWRGVIDRPTPKPIQPLQTIGTGVLVHGIAQTPQIAGDVVRGVEMFARHPVESVTLSQYGLGIMAGSTVEGFKNRPLQTAGAFAGQMLVFGGLKRGYTRGREYVRYRGRQYIPPEQVIEPSVLSGKESFPVTRPHTSPTSLIAQFRASKYKHPESTGEIGGWHATTNPFASTTKAVPGSSSVPGMHIAPSLSTHFTRIQTAKAPRKLIGFDNPPKAPTGIWVNVKGMSTIPKNYNQFDPSVFKDLSLKIRRTPQSTYILKDAPKGDAFVTPKFEARSRSGHIPESELTIPPGTTLQVVSKDYYTKLAGKKIGLDKYAAVGEKSGATADIPGKSQSVQLGRPVSKDALYEYVHYQKPYLSPSDVFKPRYPGESPYRSPSIPSYESPGYPGYEPSRSPGYKPSGYSGYEPQGYPGYEPSRSPGYKPSGYSGYEPQGYPGYKPQGYPGYKPPGYSGYEPQGYPGYEPPGYPGYEPSGYPGYEPPGYPGYKPQGYPGYEPPGYPGYELPVYPQPGKPKSPFDFDLKEEFIPRKKKKSSSKESETYPWFPAGLGHVTMEESMTGLPALHIADPGKTRSLHQKYKLTGKEIPTLRQIKIGGM